MIRKEVVVACLKITYHKLTSGTEEIHEEPH